MNTGRFPRSLLVLLLAVALTANGQELHGRVIGVLDGDTIELLVGKTKHRIRLNGIDCPEHNQAYGSKAKQFTSDWVFGQMVTVEIKTKDRYGRLVGNVVLSSGVILNNELVAHGLAWHYHQYSQDKSLAALESQARESRIGLWADSLATPPWDYRKAKKSTSTPKVTSRSHETYRCIAATKKGIQCTREAISGSMYCAQHSKAR